MVYPCRTKGLRARRGTLATPPAFITFARNREPPIPDVTLDLSGTRRTLFAALTDARSKFGGKRPIIVDGDERTLTYDEIVQAAFALGHALKKGTEPGEAVGVLLPTGLGSVIAFFALSAYGRVPAMLNFTAGAAAIRTAMQSAKIKRIVTAHLFVQIGKFEALEAALKPHAELVYLEDVRKNLSLFDKGAAAIGSLLPGVVRAHSQPDSPALILFTSGTEGEPKGVALSHANILANVEQVRAHIPLYTSDILFNPLPTFHSFGLTVGALMPLYLGIQAVLHPTPRQPHEIVRRIHEHKATILLSTDTFVSQYARAAEPGELDSLRLAVCGAERLRDETRALMKKAHPKVELLEGYGVTETSPVLAANQPGANRAGTVGHLVPGVESRLDPVEGIPGAGRLFVRGPNIMLGYLRPEAPGEIVPPPDGWHDTGDVVAFDDGYVAIRGRLKRYAKIGGETVSLTAVENCAGAVWPNHAHAAVAVPDGRKGEQIVLVTTNPDANRADLLSWMQSHGVPELAAPRKFVPVPDIPCLGTGKTDYVAVKKMVEANRAE